MHKLVTRTFRTVLLLIASLGLHWAAAHANDETTGANEQRWLAGDNHIHSRYSVGWNTDVEPATPVIGGDAIYPTPMNALMAKYYGLEWMVTTDHGAPTHSRINHRLAYPELVLSRKAVPEVLQFYGLELNTPEAVHSSLIIPHSSQERDQLYQLESQFDTREIYPPVPERDTLAQMLLALMTMDGMAAKPLLLANHPSRPATDLGVYGRVSPSDLRSWNDAAPEVAVGMAGSPGHQAAGLRPDGTMDETGVRGGYSRYPTLGGFDQMTARLGGFWDSMLGEGRTWSITANSDSHVNWKEGAWDFWPGEYSKTYVFARKEYDAIIDGIRGGRIFVTTGDLISELYISARTKGGAQTAEGGIGGEITVPRGSTVEVSIQFREPDSNSFGPNKPPVRRVDLIRGQIAPPGNDLTLDVNPSTEVLKRFSKRQWSVREGLATMTYSIKKVTTDQYIRVRGTNTSEKEPKLDTRGEDPRLDLWFYSNPIFIRVSSSE